MNIHQKRHLLDLLGQGRLKEVVEALLNGNYALSKTQKQFLQKWQAKLSDNYSDQTLRQRLREIIESVSRSSTDELEDMPPAPAPMNPLPDKDGGIIKQTWDKLSDLFRGRPTSSAPTQLDPFDLDPADSSRKPTKKSSRPPRRMEPQESAAPPPPVSPAPAPPPASASPSPTQTGGGQVNPFQQAKLLYVVPPQMLLQKISHCRIRIAPEQLRDIDLQAGLSEAELAHAQTEGIKMTQYMRVEMLNYPTDTDHFRISCQNSLDQLVLPFTVSEWVFDVVPQRPGKYALLIRVTARIDFAGTTRSFDLVVLNRAVEVTIGDGIQVEVEESTQPIPDNDWDDSDIRYVEQALLNNEIARAIERLANFIQDKDRDLHTILLVQQSAWNLNSNKLAEGLIATADWDLMNRKTLYAITQVHEKIKELDFERDQREALTKVRQELEQA